MQGQPVEECKGRIEQIENHQHRETVSGDHLRACPYQFAHEHEEQANGDLGRQQMNADPDPVGWVGDW